MDLFICGNGFDLAHGMGTEYNDFRDWLIKKFHTNEDEEYYDLPSYSTNYKGLEIYDKGKFARLFRTLIDNAEINNCHENNHLIDWKDFEELLGKINWLTVDTLSTEVYDKDGDIDPFKTSNNYADAANEVLETCHILKKLFRDWIEQIDFTNIIAKNELKCFFENNELTFLNFNYTSTLEYLYNISKVNHIHGYVNDYSDFVVGHEIENNLYLSGEDDYMRMEANDNLRACHSFYKKNTGDIIKKNKNFFNYISSVNKIYFYGFGFGNSDRRYLDKLVATCKNAKIFICRYQYENKFEVIKKALDLSGYKGEIYPMSF